MKASLTIVSTLFFAGLVAPFPVVAATGSPALFPTDVLNKSAVAFTTKYAYSTSEHDTLRQTAPNPPDVLNLKSTSNLLQLGLQMGLGGGLQFGYSQLFELNARDKSSLNGAAAALTRNSEIYDPSFELAWSPTRVCSSKKPLQMLLSYRVKPKGTASDKLINNYSLNSAGAVISYRLMDNKLRPYIGYDYTWFGEENHGPGGHTNTVLAGFEYAVTKRLKLSLDYSAQIFGGSSKYESYVVDHAGISAQYKLPFVKSFGLYVVPSFKAAVSESTKYAVAGTGFDSLKTNPSVTYSSGLALKSVF